MKNEQLIIIDEIEPKMTLDEVLENTPSTRIDRLIGHNIIPESVTDYYQKAMDKRETARLSRLTDTNRRDKLYFLLKSIDKSAMSDLEEAAIDNILSKYRN